MKPLKLDELRKMNGKPYWHVGLQDDSPKPHWKILDPFVARNPEDYGYGKRWLAYAAEPPRINREAWEPCDLCKSCFTCAYVLTSLGAEPCFSCEQFSNHKPMEFCSHCGRPLTDAAWEMLEKRLEGLK